MNFYKLDRILYYYKRLIHHKVLYYRVGKELGVSLYSRLFHNFKLLSPLVAFMQVNNYSRYYIFYKSYLNNSSYTIDYWYSNNIRVVPERYIKMYLADQLASFDLDYTNYLRSLRDLVFTNSIAKDYQPQILEVYKRYIR